MTNEEIIKWLENNKCLMFPEFTSFDELVAWAQEQLPPEVERNQVVTVLSGYHNLLIERLKKGLQ